jgi:hypothetical protein
MGNDYSYATDANNNCVWQSQISVGIGVGTSLPIEGPGDATFARINL